VALLELGVWELLASHTAGSGRGPWYLGQGPVCRGLIINHLNAGTPGYVFADWITGLLGTGLHAQISAQGEPALQHARAMARKYRDQFIADRELKDRVLRPERALLPPRPRRRGRPGDPRVTCAIRLCRKFQRQYPQESSREIWDRICVILIPGYAALSEMEKRTEREQLQQRVRWRLRKRRRRKIPVEISV
jgi:hypothetical protein